MIAEFLTDLATRIISSIGGRTFSDLERISWNNNIGGECTASPLFHGGLSLCRLS